MFLAVSILTEAAIPDPPTSGITTVGSLKIGTAADCAGVVAFSATQASVDVSLIFKRVSNKSTVRIYQRNKYRSFRRILNDSRIN